MPKGITTRATAKRINKIPIIIFVSGLALILILCFYAVSKRQKKMQNAATTTESIQAPPINNDTQKPQFLSEGYIKELEAQALREKISQQVSAAEEQRRLKHKKDQPEKENRLNQEIKGLGYTPGQGPEKNFQPEAQNPPNLMPPEKTEEELFREKIKQQRRELALEARMAPISKKSNTFSKGPTASLPKNALTGLTPQYQQSGTIIPQQEKPDQKQKRDFLNSATQSKVSLANAYHKASSPYELKQGHLIPMTLITKINSDLPGRIKAQVTENVYDTATGNHLLIPQGTMINGIYDSRVVFGQKRALIAWQRLIFPDSSSLNVGSMPGTDQEGSAGLADIVDNHYFEIFGSALLMSVVNAGFTLITDKEESLNNKETAQDALAKSAAQQMQQTFSRLIDKIMSIQPEIIIRQGKQGHIILTKDVIGLKPYNPAQKPTYYLKTATID